MDEALDDRIDRGLVVLGGCIISDDEPAWQCNICGNQIYQDEYK